MATYLFFSLEGMVNFREEILVITYFYFFFGGGDHFFYLGRDGHLSSFLFRIDDHISIYLFGGGWPLIIVLILGGDGHLSVFYLGWDCHLCIYAFYVEGMDTYLPFNLERDGHLSIYIF